MECKNCENVLSQDDDYCNQCGAKIIRNRLTIKSLFHHINETFFNYDNKFLRTFINLFRKPEDVIVGYIGGTRKKYVDVISYFALALTLSGLQILFLSKLDMDMSLYDTSKDLGRQQQAMFDNFYKFTTEYQSLVMMLYIPFYALLAKLLFRRYKKFNYTELLVVFLYAQAHFSIASVLIVPFIGIFEIMSFASLGMMLLFVQIIYFIYVLKRVFGLTGRQIFFRTLVFILWMILLFILCSILAAFFMINQGMLDK